MNGRKSKLTDVQWHGLEMRLIAGEKAADLAREYGIHRSQITKKIKPKTDIIKEVAHKVVDAEIAFKSLPLTQQIATLTLIDDLKAISTNLASAGKLSSINANRLAELANQQINSVHSDYLEDGVEALKMASVLTTMANDASKIPMGLLLANKDQVQKISNPEVEQVKTLSDFYAGSDNQNDSK